MPSSKYYYEKIQEVDRLSIILEEGGTETQLEYLETLLNRRKMYEKLYFEELSKEPDPPVETWRTIWGAKKWYMKSRLTENRYQSQGQEWRKAGMYIRLKRPRIMKRKSG